MFRVFLLHKYQLRCHVSALATITKQINKKIYLKERSVIAKTVWKCGISFDFQPVSGKAPNATFQACHSSVPVFLLDFSPLDHSTSTSLTDTNTSLSSSDNDHSSRIEHGTPIGRRTSSQVVPRPTTEVSESEAAKEVLKGSRCNLHC